MARSKTAFEDYDPNKLQNGLWGVYKGSRLLTYAQRGPALNAFSDAYQAKLYRLVDGQGWVLLAVKHAGMRGDDCEVCSRSIKDSFNQSWDTRKRWQWERDVYGKIADPPRLYNVCLHCVPVVEAGRV